LLRVNPKYPIKHVAPQHSTDRNVHILIFGWLYVALMMAVAEATSTSGSIIGAVVTFLLYGVAPVSLLVYLLSTPARKRAIKAREAAELAEESAAPDACGEAPADAVPPVRKEP
jgi:hypothetical protein